MNRICIKRMNHKSFFMNGREIEVHSVELCIWEMCYVSFVSHVKSQHEKQRWEIINVSF